ncbi:MAG: transporter, permease protein [Verrucomicrobiales bacterium]|nr:transporter, permease protein [Verrucomicrobiales bacterium]
MNQSSLGNITTLAKRELKGYFASPVAYVFIVIFLLLVGFFTFMLGNAPFFKLGQASLDSFFKWHPWVFLFLVPAIGMRVWSEERRLGTIELLLTMPITAWQAIVGKFLASWAFLLLTLICTFPIIMTVNYLGKPDNGVIFGAYVGSFLMAGSYLAISCMTSAITRNQVISFILSCVICFLLILCGYPPVTEFLTTLGVSQSLIETIASLSFMTHFDAFQKGILDFRDLVFFFSVIGFSLFTTGVILRSHRAG